jgi:ribose/xylose/arabinose/galactoside ABC-type transport system permease subunit
MLKFHVRFLERITSLKHLQHRGFIPQLSLIMVFLVMVLALSWLSPFFFKWNNLRNVFDQSTLNIITGVGMTLVICTGGIDLSVGAVVALCGVVMAVSLHSGMPAVPSILTGLATGALAGLGNGLLVALLKINPFIVTLGSMSVIRGLALIITGGIPIYGFPDSFTWWGSGTIGIFPSTVVLAIFVALAGAVILNHTKFGYYALAIGGNEEALRRSGVKTDFYKVLVYITSGFTAALSALVVTARLNTAEPLAGWMFELDAIATVVLGGTSMRGGNGSIAGTVIAGLLLAVLRNGLTILSIPSYYQQLLIGIIILVAVIVTEIKSRNETGSFN